MSSQVPESIDRCRSRSLRKFGIDDDSDAAAALKKKFQKLDESGNGMIELSELSSILPLMKPSDVKILFQQIDVNASGTISFSEFVDFLFKPGDEEEANLTNDRDPALSEITKVRSFIEGEELTRERVVPNVSFDGALLYKAVNRDMQGQDDKTYNGFPTFECTQSARIRNTEPLLRADRQNNAIEAAETQPQARTGFVDVNYHVIFDDEFIIKEGPHLQAFYCWTSDLSKVGWFIAESRPPEGQPISNFVLFNPSVLADTPDKCRAMWQTTEGDCDKRLFCENTGLRAQTYEHEVPEGSLDDEELWGDLSEDVDADWKRGDYEQEWKEQVGEAEIAEDGWDSDVWCKKNAHRALIGEQARQKRLERQRAKEIKDAQAQAVLANEVLEAKPDAGNFKKRRRKKVQRGVNHVRHAPGFVVRKVVHEDHLAQKEKPKKPLRVEKVDGEAEDPSEEEDCKVYEDGKFIDDDFPPCSHSLGVKMSGVDGWMRLSDITANPCLFFRIIPETCVNQAFPGNMWLTSACAAAAEYPAWIQSMFGRKPRLSKAGKYNVRLYHPGQKQFVRITIDDYVPTKNGSPAFAGVSSDGEIWSALVEKAFAKLCGSYAATEWGLNAYGMHYICGGSCTASWSRLGPSRWRRSCTVWNGGAECPLDRGLSEGKVEVGDWRDEDEVWAMLRMSMERCYPVACGIDREEKAAVGLHTQRLYSVIDVREVPTDQGWTLRMVLLRNPYDTGKWEGRWSDHSDAWKANPAVRASLEHKPNVGSKFWMSFTDFQDYFEEIDIVRKSMPVQGCDRHKLRGVKRGLVKHE